jgi:hypothetical protein
VLYVANDYCALRVQKENLLDEEQRLFAGKISVRKSKVHPRKGYECPEGE